MSAALLVSVFLLLLVIVLAVVMVGIFNTLVTYGNRYKNAFAQIEVQLKRRYDLIPNLWKQPKGIWLTNARRSKR